MIQITSTPEFQMSLLLFFALAGYLVASRINQSAVIGEIIFGLIIGPSVLGIITYTEFVNGLAHLGAVVLLFVIGLEFRLADIFKTRYLVIASFGVIIPWVAGYYLSRLFGFNFEAALFVGTAMTATSIAITANVLREMGKLQTEAAKAIIGAAVIDDVLSLLALSISIGLISGTFSYSLVLFTFLKTAGFIAAGFLVGYFLLNRLITHIDNTKAAQKYPEVIFISAMAIAFFYATSAELIGLSAIIGSFIAGVTLQDIGLKHTKHYKEGAEYLHIIFASIFFISLGILADFKALTAGVIWFLVTLTIVAVITKVIGCGVSARLQGMSLKDSLVVGFGMSPRGEVAMIIALIGLNQHLIGQKIYVILVLMSLLTTIITPLILKNWFYKERTLKFKIRRSSI